MHFNILLLSTLLCGPVSPFENSSVQFLNNGPRNQRFSRFDFKKGRADHYIGLTTESIADANPVVETKSGKVRGFTMETVTSRPLLAFQRIPFAQPPVNELRFQDPKEPVPWDAVLDATVESPECIQMEPLKNLSIYGQEDCLYLNLYRPARNFSHKLPVMVWIHGGAWIHGSGTIYGPAYLLDHDIVLITFNYRLGPLGFLSTGDDASSGNYGLKDMVFALKWVKENVALFGGNTQSVTIFGESVGAFSVQLLMVSPLSQGLFHRAISQSGSATCPLTLQHSGNDPNIAQKAGELLNCTGSSHEMIDCLRSVDAKTLVDVQIKLREWKAWPEALFKPVIEHNSSSAFMTESVEEAYRNGRVAAVPWIVGVTADEMTRQVAVTIQQEDAVYDINTEWDRVGPLMLELATNQSINETVSRKAREIRQFYAGENDLTFDSRHQFSRMFSDRVIIACTFEGMRLHLKYTEAPVYPYRLSYRGRYSIVQLFQQDPADWGVSHLDDLIYLFNTTEMYSSLQPSDEEFKMSRIMTSMWTNFVYYGKPFLSLGNQLWNIWENISRRESKSFPFIRILDLNLNPKMIPNPYVERFNFWKVMGLL